MKREGEKKKEKKSNKKRNKKDIYSEEKRRVFSFYLNKESEEESLTERGREFQITDPDVLK